MRNALVPFALALSLVACGGGYNDLDAAIAGEDCTVTSNNQNAIMSTDEVHCADGTIISWHANKNDRDMYGAFVEGLLGRGPDQSGPDYLVFRG